MALRGFCIAVLGCVTLSACQTAQFGNGSVNAFAPFGSAKPVANTKKIADATKSDGKIDENKLSFANATDASAAIVAVESQATGSKQTKLVTIKQPNPGDPIKALFQPQSKSKKVIASGKVKGLPGVKLASIPAKKSKRKKKLNTVKAGRIKYGPMIAKHAKTHGVPVKLAMAVVEVESSYRPKSTGRAGEIGLMQLLPTTARYIGYKGSMRKLYNPDTNIQYGMKYLGKAHRLGGGSLCGTILKYNAGHGAKKMNRISREYCRRIRKIMRRS